MRDKAGRRQGECEILNSIKYDCSVMVVAAEVLGGGMSFERKEFP